MLLFIAQGSVRPPPMTANIPLRQWSPSARRTSRRSISTYSVLLLTSLRSVRGWAAPHRPPPRAAPCAALWTDGNDADDDLLSSLLRHADADAPLPLVLRRRPGTGRGLCLRTGRGGAPPGVALLSVPLAACLVAAAPGDGAGEGWASSLTAAALGMLASDALRDAAWRRLLPPPGAFRGSLPVRWPEGAVGSSGSRALEGGADASFFARAEVAADIGASDGGGADYAMDLVQTRTCRIVADGAGGADATTYRVLAPVFDMINHSDRPNAEFLYWDGDDGKTPSLVVRTIGAVADGEEIKISYGGEGATSPPWRCLLNYGFVAEGGAGEVGEVAVEGSARRFEVGPEEVPYELVVAVYDLLEGKKIGCDAAEADTSGEVSLTPEVAEHIASLCDEAVLRLSGIGDREETGENDTTAEMISVLCKNLRESQTMALSAAAGGLRVFADEMEKARQR